MCYAPIVGSSGGCGCITLEWLSGTEGLQAEWDKYRDDYRIYARECHVSSVTEYFRILFGNMADNDKIMEFADWCER